MKTSLTNSKRMLVRLALAAALTLTVGPLALLAQPETVPAPAEHMPGGEVNIHLPDLNQGDFLGMTGHQILLSGLVVCVLGLMFGAWTYAGVKRLPVHR